MLGDIAFPVYVMAKDCGEITVFSNFEKMRWHFEPIDIENDEFEAWDAHGRALALKVGSKKSEWLQVVETDQVLPTEQFDEIKAKAVPYRDPEPLMRVIARKLGFLRADG